MPATSKGHEAAVTPEAALPARLRCLPVVAPLLGVLTAALLLLHGLVLDTQAPIPSIIWTIAPALVLALLVGAPPRAVPGRSGLLASPPLAFGLVTVTTVFGTTLLDAEAWWIGGAVASVGPFLLAALCARRARSA